jgi:hypothetical protein
VTEREQYLLMGAIDRELSSAERREFEQLLETDAEVQSEWSRLKRVKGLTDSMEFKMPSDAIWEGYMASVYRRVERSIAWILLSVGSIVLISTGLWHTGKAIFIEDNVPLYIKASLLALFVGGAILIVSVAREKLFMHKKDPYKDVIR